jgi:hypothetical protein
MAQSKDVEVQHIGTIKNIVSGTRLKVVDPMMWDTQSIMALSPMMCENTEHYGVEFL